MVINLLGVISRLVIIIDTNSGVAATSSCQNKSIKTVVFGGWGGYPTIANQNVEQDACLGGSPCQRIVLD